MTHCDNRVTRCRSFSKLLISTTRATKELSFDISFKTVHNAKAKLWPLNVKVVVEWPLRENGVKI